MSISTPRSPFSISDLTSEIGNEIHNPSLYYIANEDRVFPYFPHTQPIRRNEENTRAINNIDTATQIANDTLLRQPIEATTLRNRYYDENTVNTSMYTDNLNKIRFISEENQIKSNTTTTDINSFLKKFLKIKINVVNKDDTLEIKTSLFIDGIKEEICSDSDFIELGD